MNDQQGRLPISPSRPVQNGAASGIYIPRPGHTMPAQPMGNGIHRTNGTLGQNVHHGGIKAKRTKKRFPPTIRSPSSVKSDVPRTSAYTTGGLPRTSETIPNHSHAANNVAAYNQTRDERTTPNGHSDLSRPRFNLEPRPVLNSMAQPNPSPLKVKEYNPAAALAGHVAPSPLHRDRDRFENQGLGKRQMEEMPTKKEPSMSNQRFSVATTQNEHRAMRKPSDDDASCIKVVEKPPTAQLPPSLKIEKTLSPGIGKDRQLTRPAERQLWEHQLSAATRDRNSVPRTNDNHNHQQTRETGLGLSAHKASLPTTSAALPRFRETAFEKPHPPPPIATLNNGSTFESSIDLDAVVQRIESSAKTTFKGFPRNMLINSSRTQPHLPSQKASLPGPVERQSSERSKSSVPHSVAHPVPSIPGDRASSSHKISSASVSEANGKRGTVEDRRMAIVAKHDSAAFDAQIYAQDGARSPPPGVFRRNHSDARGETTLEDTQFIHANPRIHGMHERSSDWHVGKAEEIRRRGGRKLWFGKPVERKKWVRQQAALREAGKLSEKPPRKDPKPWGHQTPADFGAVQEKDLPGYVKENPAWLRICARLREDKSNRLQPGANTETSRKQGAAEKVRAAAMDEATREKVREEFRKQAREEVQRQVQMTKQAEVGARTSPAYNVTPDNRLGRGDGTFPAQFSMPNFPDRGSRF